MPFARNSLCALVEPGVKADSAGLLERMLDPHVRVGISTPKADPSGDYAFALFDRAEAVKPGAAAASESQGPATDRWTQFPAPAARSVELRRDHARRKADVFLTYCTNAALAVREVDGLQVVAVPEELAVGAQYGLLVLGDRPEARKLADFILSSRGQNVLRKFGFDPP